MSPRERFLALLVGVTVVGLGGYLLVVEPVLDAFARVGDETTQAQSELRAAQTLVDNQRRIEGRWVGYRHAGLHDGEFDARRRAQESITQWCESSRLTIVNMEPSKEPKVDEDERFAEVTIRLTAEGSIRSLQSFLQQVSTAPFPLRVESCSIANRSQGDGALVLTMTLSTIFEADNLDNQPGGA